MSTSGSTTLYVRQPKPDRKCYSKTDESTHGLLEQNGWKLYKQITSEILSAGTCEVHKCQSEEELEDAIVIIKKKLREEIEENFNKSKTTCLQSSFAKRNSQYADRADQLKDNVIKSLRDNSEKVMTAAESQLLKVKQDRIESMRNKTPMCIQNQGSDEVAEMLISMLTDKITQYVSTLLPLQIQQHIICNKFSCQKSFVIKKMMMSFIEDDCFYDSLSYILHPNDFAKTWLKNYTNKNIFKKRAGKHRYSTFAEKKVDGIMKMIETVMYELQNKDTLSSWIECFFDRVQKSELLPLSKDEFYFNDVQYPLNFNMSSFLLIVKHRLENIKDGVNQNFIVTTQNNVIWTENPHEKIMESLWGCTHCCPFCHEPCHFSDISQVPHGQQHRCLQHRPLGVYGFMDETNNTLITEWCNSLIETNDKGYKFTDDESLRHCKSYQNEFNDWKIETTETATSKPLYWIWFLYNYREQLKDFYGAEIPKFPDTWKNVTQKDAIQSLNNVYISKF